MERSLETKYDVLSHSDLSESDKELLKIAADASTRAYAPYSKFKVGAAVRLDNGKVVSGNNQENIAYPSGLCAERTAIYSAAANYPDIGILEIAIATEAVNDMTEPIAPCGACRQAMAEYEIKQNKPIRILLAGKEEVIVIRSSLDLLPLVFNPKILKS